MEPIIIQTQEKKWAAWKVLAIWRGCFELEESSRYTIPNSARPLHIKDGETFFVSLERPPVISEDGPGSVPRGACPPLLGGSEDASRRRYFTLADIARNGCFICAVQAKAKMTEITRLYTAVKAVTRFKAKHKVKCWHNRLLHGNWIRLHPLNLEGLDWNGGRQTWPPETCK